MAYNKFFILGKRWQDFHRRTTSEAMQKVLEEIGEYLEVKGENKLDELDELGDVLVNMARVYLSLPPKERAFVERVATMKADKRLPNGKKDKRKEKEQMLVIARKLGLI